MRQRGVTMKLNPLREVVRGKRLTVVDDSIVRGTTTKQIVALLRQAGAAEVHVRISAPPIYHPCFYGIDTQVETELIAATHIESRRSASSSAPTRSATSRSAASSRALDLPYDRFCFACFDGRYPEPVPYDVGVAQVPARGAGARRVPVAECATRPTPRRASTSTPASAPSS